MMAAERTPWYRASVGAWYVQFNGKQVRLAKGRDNRADAMKAFYKLMASDEVPTPAAITVVEVCDQFLEWSSKRHKPDTYTWAKHFLGGFCNHKVTGRLLATAVRVFHLTRWVDDHPDWTGARRSSQQVVKRAFSWAKHQGLIEKDPFADVKLPPIRARKRLLTVTEQAEILSAVDDEEFRNYLVALQESGARPSEVAKVTAANVDLELGMWVFEDHKTADETDEVRVVYLSPRLLDLTRLMVQLHPTGPLFPNRRGKMFNRNAVRCRFRRLEKKLPHLGRVQAYLYRHQFATAALEGGVGVAQVAELLGHKSTDMVMRHYGHLSQKVRHMRDMAAKATSHNMAT